MLSFIATRLGQRNHLYMLPSVGQPLHCLTCQYVLPHHLYGLTWVPQVEQFLFAVATEAPNSTSLVASEWYWSPSVFPGVTPDLHPLYHGEPLHLFCFYRERMAGSSQWDDQRLSAAPGCGGNNKYCSQWALARISIGRTT